MALYKLETGNRNVHFSIGVCNDLHHSINFSFYSLHFPPWTKLFRTNDRVPIVDLVPLSILSNNEFYRRGAPKRNIPTFLEENSPIYLERV